MANLSARQAVALYAALGVVLNVSILLPGNPDFASTRGLIAGVTIQALIVWRLWHGSTAAWLLGFVFAVIGVLSIISIVGSPDGSEVLVVALSAAQAAVLALPPIATFVWRRHGSLASR